MKNLFFILLLLCNTGFAQVNITKGLKAYYPFNGNANDASGNNNNPVFNNATLTSDRIGNPNSAYHFNGINTYIQIPNNPSLNFGNQVTLAVWVRPTGFYYDICHASSIILKGTADYYPGNYALRFDDALFTGSKGCSGDPLTDSVHLNFRGTGTSQIPYTPYIKKNQWYSLVYTNDGTTAKLYVDCELKYAINFKETFTNNDDLLFGKTNDPIFPFWLNADIDDVRIYDRALNTNEIFALCKEEKKKDTNKAPEPVKAPFIDTIKTSTTPKETPLEKRNNELVKQITVEHDSVSVTLYDNGEIDGDSVTLIYNNKIITTHQRLSDKPITFNLKVEPGNNRNELVMYAENLGSIPPNTALMVIYDGKKRYELNISSTKDSNGVVAFRLKE
ncbi:LamG domain-containing protein [Ferruginibacter sp. SUN106]|uniref:LamG domain-containing protein n=1 Tax=Ferruginibacter sp. SUN106 TaxID=2978348 RepID=UPI003D36F9E6